MSDAGLDLDCEGRGFFEQIALYLSLEDRDKVRRAFELARREHGDVRRRSGELFFMHPLTVAFYLAEYYADAPSLIAALLHDVAEDTSVSVQTITAMFGEEVGRLVDGVTKFDRMTAKAKLGRELSDSELKAATHYKLFEVLTSDVRVGLVKIFDRLHNMRTMGVMPPHKQREKSWETLSVYAPLAYRLGMWQVKEELQKLAIEILDPVRYHSLLNRVERYGAMYEVSLKEVREKLLAHLKGQGVVAVDVLFTEPDVHYLYQKYMRRKSYRELPHDLEEVPGVVVLVKDKPSCYMALGCIHGLWAPLPGTFDDYVAAPRENSYRALHTTVMADRMVVRVRVRSLEMQIEAQMGVLSGWLNDSGIDFWESGQMASHRLGIMMSNITERIEWELGEMSDGVRTVLEDVFTNQMIVYTPKGEQKELPQGATAVDFAYTIHTEVGHGCRGATVHGREIALNEPLQEGDMVKIVTHGREPQRIWLDEDLGYLKTNSARAAVRRWFRRLPQKQAIRHGKRLLEDELKMLGVRDCSHAMVAGWLGFEEAALLYYALGRAEVYPTAVAVEVLTKRWLDDEPIKSQLKSVLSADGEEWFTIAYAGDRELKLCGVCRPRPLDDILGYIRKDKQVTVHCRSCALINRDKLHNGNSLKLRWGEEGEDEVRYPIAFQVEVNDRDGLLFEITDLLRHEQINILLVFSQVRNHHAFIVLGIEVQSPHQYVSLLHRVQALYNVVEARTLPIEPEVWMGLGKGEGDVLFSFKAIEEMCCVGSG